MAASSETSEIKLVIFRLVVLESGLGLESGLESIFAGLGLELKGLGLGLGLETPGLGLGLGSFFLHVLCQVHLALVTGDTRPNC